ncbi:Ig-like domain-containing protein [Flavilitoribacter nigricans]|uniref:T9SS type A sorting domain-containing protein n=1 Tax=Flavilitoribacter nigricans (strain ATCC 23147 / DSM 23189 / NBRC 102662 / NCIMB 1420 / SS-2) TaxID=1122177 RepID=A0A2D0NDM5_FLAN2|nr:T9SS type A sorting domain-containing protein [Flavilitoribacter nigricans]PHN06577.1 hypothetical protein CRP01_09740 [Flavilitoribacter nigricans DSM 23189 = NBRC 102662]
MRITRSLLITCSLLCLTALSLFAQNVDYGIVKEGDTYTAVAFPDFSSGNVTISTAVFTLLLPEGTLTDPAIPDLPENGSFTDHTGTWRAFALRPDVYEGVGYDPADLEGNDVYNVVLQNSPSPAAAAGQPIPLFSFQLPAGCTGGSVSVLINDSPIQQAILNNLNANFNNQISMSVDDAPSVDIYSSNDPATAAYSCGGETVDGKPEARSDRAVAGPAQTITIDVLANDDFGPNGAGSGSIRIVSAPAYGTATVDTGANADDQSDDAIRYTPALGLVGQDVLTYEICDADGDCDQASVRIRYSLFRAKESTESTVSAVNTGTQASSFELAAGSVKTAPNPFREMTTLGFRLNTAGTVSLRIFSSQGQLLHRIESDYTAGQHQIELDAANWPAAGMYVYELQTPDFKKRGRLIRMD